MQAVAGWLGSLQAAAHFHLLLEEIGAAWPEPFAVSPHGDQLSKSIKAVYGSEFDSHEYLRRFFTRRYELRNHSVVELAAAVFLEWEIDQSRFVQPDVLVATGYPLTVPRLMGLIVAQWSVTPREIYSIMDALRLFVGGWEHPDPIEPMALLSLIVKMVRGQPFSFEHPATADDLRIKGTTYSHSGEASAQVFTVASYLKSVSPRAYRPLNEVVRERGTPDAAANYLLEILQNEWRARHNRSPEYPIGQSHLTDYIPRLVELARFIDQADD